MERDLKNIYSGRMCLIVMSGQGATMLSHFT